MNWNAWLASLKIFRRHVLTLPMFFRNRTPSLPIEMSDWAIYVVVIVTILSTFGLHPEMSLWHKLLFLALLVPYTALMISGTSFCERLRARSWQVIYFIGLSLLGTLIFYLSSGVGWLVLLPVAAQTTYFFSWLGTFFLNFVILFELMFVVRLMSGDWSDLVQSGVSFLAAQVFVIIFTYIAAKEEKGRHEVERLAAELGQANQKLREYAAQVEEVAILQERNRLARDIHDGLGHYLTALNMQIKAAQAVLPVDVNRAQDALSKAQSLAQDALAGVRQSVAALREEPALQQPLPDALAALLAECREAGLVADLAVAGEMRPLSVPVTITVYRAAQEALTNVRKHALASRVSVTLHYLPDRVCLRVADNGVGAHAIGDEQIGFGLLGLRERVTLLGGSVKITTASRQGFALEVEIRDDEQRPE